LTATGGIIHVHEEKKIKAGQSSVRDKMRILFLMTRLKNPETIPGHQQGHL
jgi:hypothetical protein